MFDVVEVSGRFGREIMLFPETGGIEFLFGCLLGFLDEAMAANHAAASVPEPGYPESARGFELEQTLPEGVDFG